MCWDAHTPAVMLCRYALAGRRKSKPRGDVKIYPLSPDLCQIFLLRPSGVLGW